MMNESSWSGAAFLNGSAHSNVRLPNSLTYTTDTLIVPAINHDYWKFDWNEHCGCNADLERDGLSFFALLAF